MVGRAVASASVGNSDARIAARFHATRHSGSAGALRIAALLFAPGSATQRRRRVSAA
jgi:hypothetical protein